MARRSVGPWYRTGKGAWYATVAGRKVALGVSGRGNKAAAVAAWHRLMVEQATKPAAVTVRELCNEFLADAADRLKASTVCIYRVHVDLFQMAFGSRPALSLTVGDVRLWSQSLPHNSTTRAMTLRSLSACFGWAVKVGRVPANVIKDVPKPRSRVRGQEAVVESETFARMLAIASPQFRPLLLTLYGIGCRPGEACRATVESFHADAGVIILTEHKADATGRPRVLYLTPELTAELRPLAERYTAGPLFRTGRGNAWTPRLINRQVRRLADRLGVKAMAYGFRHAYATRALAAGVPDAHVAALLGHTSTAMLYRHYSHLTARADVLRNAAARVG